MPYVTFNRGTRASVELTRGVAPTDAAAANSQAASYWWNGGCWVNIITDGIPDIVDNQATIFAEGFAGRRSKNQYRPVQGRHWSEGGFATVATPDVLAQLLYAALGDASVNALPGGSELAPNIVLTAVGAHNLVTQPTGGGKFLQFDLRPNAATSMGVSGIEAYGNPASEILTAATCGVFYTRTAFSSVGASGINTGTASVGALTVKSNAGWQYTIIPASGNSGQTLSIDDLGHPAAGATSRSRMHNRMLVRELTIENDAEGNDGLLMLSATFLGDPTATCVAPAIDSASILRIFPGWSLLVRKESGSGIGTPTWNKVTNFRMNINNESRVYGVANQSRRPVGQFWGGYEVTGEIGVLVDDEIEFNRWQAASVLDMFLQWDAGHDMGASNVQLNASLFNAYVESFPAATDDDGQQVVNLGFRTIDGNDLPVRFLIQCGVPPCALGLA